MRFLVFYSYVSIGPCNIRSLLRLSNMSQKRVDVFKMHLLLARFNTVFIIKNFFFLPISYLPTQSVLLYLKPVVAFFKKCLISGNFYMADDGYF